MESSSGEIRLVAKEVVAKTKKKEPWWWNLEVQNAVKEKKEVKKELDSDPQSIARKDEYTKAKKKAKNWAFKSLYEKLQSRKRQKMVMRIAKQKYKENQDVYLAKCMKDKMGRPLYQGNDIKQKWKTYFETDE